MIMLITGLLFLVIILVTGQLAKLISRPVNELVTGTVAVMGADYDYQVLGRSADFRIRDVRYSKDIVTIEKNSFANMLYINSAGNLGIGTTTPSSKLHVLGDIKAEYGVIATTGTFSIGENVPNLHYLVLCQSRKSEIEIVQQIGRALRKHKENKLIE